MYRLRMEFVPWSSPYKAGLAGKNPTSREPLFAVYAYGNLYEQIAYLLATFALYNRSI